MKRSHRVYCSSGYYLVWSSSLLKTSSCLLGMDSIGSSGHCCFSFPGSIFRMLPGMGQQALQSGCRHLEQIPDIFQGNCFLPELNSHSPGLIGKFRSFRFNRSLSIYKRSFFFTRKFARQKVFLLRWWNFISINTRTGPTHMRKLRALELPWQMQI